MHHRDIADAAESAISFVVTMLVASAIRFGACNNAPQACAEPAHQAHPARCIGGVGGGATVPPPP